MNPNDLGLLNTQIKELRKEVRTLKIERKALFFIATCGISYAVLQFAPLASTILLVVSFSFCFLENIISGEHFLESETLSHNPTSRVLHRQQPPN
jgi:hypothetical protein